MTVTLLRAERVLLFDDALVLLQVGVGLTTRLGARGGVWGLVEKGVGKRQTAGRENLGSWGADGGRKAEYWGLGVGSMQELSLKACGLWGKVTRGASQP